jgi:serine/threonine protein kinase
MVDKDFTQTKNLRELFSGKSVPTINYYFERNKNIEYYIRNNCIHSDTLDIDDSDDGYIAQGKCGVVRKGRFLSSDGILKDGIFKILISSITNTIELEEIKYAIELNKLSPDSVIKIELVEKFDLLKEDAVSDTKEIIIIGMEKGSSNLDKYLLELVDSDLYEFERVLSLALDACDAINRVGYFHRDIKPSNIVIVNRNGINVPVVIDFGSMCYMSNIDNNKYNLTNRNPPLDSFYLALYVLGIFETNKDLNPICLHFVFKFYRILRFYIPSDSYIKNVNKKFFNHYFNKPLGSDYFDKVFLKYFKKTDLSMKIPPADISKYIQNRITDEIENAIDFVEIKNYNNSSILFNLIQTELQNILQLNQKTYKFPLLLLDE